MELTSGATCLVMSGDSDWPEAVHKCHLPPEGEADGEVQEGKLRVKYRELEAEVMLNGKSYCMYATSVCVCFDACVSK